MGMRLDQLRQNIYTGTSGNVLNAILPAFATHAARTLCTIRRLDRRTRTTYGSLATRERERARPRSPVSQVRRDQSAAASSSWAQVRCGCSYPSHRALFVGKHSDPNKRVITVVLIEDFLPILPLPTCMLFTDELETTFEYGSFPRSRTLV
jgi:hypothetical protein